MSIIKKSILVIMSIIMTFTCVSAAGEKVFVDEDINILCIGNSILSHGVSASLGWDGEWGMAASAEENDYYHLLQSKVKEAGYSNVTWNKINSYHYERVMNSQMDYDYLPHINEHYTTILTEQNPDIIVFQLGENVDGVETTEAYEYALVQFANYCKSLNPDVQIIFCMPFWGGEVKCPGTKAAAQKAGFAYADLSQFNTHENMALGLFEHDGVASHPGDLGMKNIANEIFSQLEIVLNKKFANKDLATVMLNGKYISCDVPVRIVDGLTMLPVRAVAEACGAKVDWDEKTETVIITEAENNITMKIGDNVINKNSEEIQSEVNVFETEGRTFVSSDVISKMFDCSVEWDVVSLTARIAK